MAPVERGNRNVKVKGELEKISSVMLSISHENI